MRRRRVPAQANNDKNISEFNRSVFINAPFDVEYEEIWRGILFCLILFDLLPRIASERSTASEPRLLRIMELIQSFRYSIHDLSRCQAQQTGELYRLNMPFELGLDFGCHRYGTGHLKKKVILVLEEQPYRYQATISDLAGSDIEAHHGKPSLAVRKVRNWLADMTGESLIEADQVFRDFEDFTNWYIAKKETQGATKEAILDYSMSELLADMSEWKEEYR